MAVLLRDLYEETKDRYGLELIAGDTGLEQAMHWVYISEDPETLEFLQGGELIVTTGILCTGDDWLLAFVRGLIERHTCGLIINIGGHLNRNDIPERVKTLCEDSDYPLFLMPWETHIFDITHDYYNRIFQDTQNKQAITTAFSRIILHPDDHALTEISLPVLTEHGYGMDLAYVVIYIMDSHATDEQNHIPEPARPGFSTQSPAEIRAALMERRIRLCGLNYTVIPEHNCLLLIAPAKSRQTIEQELALLHAHEPLPPTGISDPAFGLTQLNKGYLQAQSAATYAKATKLPFCFFDNLGFYKILLSVTDTDLLKGYVTEQLGTVLAFDKQKGGNYLDTLYQYLLFDGSIQKIADALFCHRNTVNYRIRILKEDLHLKLDDSSVRFQLMTAFQIRNYLQIFSRGYAE